MTDAPADCDPKKKRVNDAIEVFIEIALVVLLIASCLLFLLPFLPLVTWGIIVAIAGYPAHRKLQRYCKGRGGLAATLFTLILLAFLVLPVILLAGTLVDGAHVFADRIQSGTLTIPPPPARIQTLPVIGPPITNLWNSTSSNLPGVLISFAPQIKEGIPWLLSASASVGFGVLKFVLSILIAGFMLANAQRCDEIACALFNRLFGEKGLEYKELIGSTIRSVTTGILGVALVQAALATLGFIVVGLPGTGLWAMAFLIAAVVQVAVLVIVPAVIYVFATASTTTAVIFLIWCIFVGLIDNFLKPILLGRGTSVPMPAVFLGAIGGFIALGIIGLFVGATIVSVGYKLFLVWLRANPSPSS